MRKLLLLPVLFMAIEGWSQQADTLNNEARKQKLTSGDTNSITPGMLNDSLLNTIPAWDSTRIKEDMERNITRLVELQNRHRSKEKRGAIIRIGIGIAFLFILIIGLQRKTTKK
jgi:hypothetical protein